MARGRMRDMSKMRSVNDGTRTLFESLMVPEVGAALRDWVRGGGGGVLVGDNALSCHARPRATQDVEVLFLRDDAAPVSVEGFERVGARAFRHRATGVEVHAVTPELARAPLAVAERVVATASASCGMAVASASGLVALLLFRPGAQARADVVALLKTGRVDLAGLPLPQDGLAAYAALVVEAAREPG